MKVILVLGAGGFIGHHLVKRLKARGHRVLGVDLKLPEFEKTSADEFILGDLRDQKFCEELFENSFHHIYQLAADMGGAGYIFTGESDSDIMNNSVQINVNIIENCKKNPPEKLFYSSSACIYPEYNQLNPDAPDCREETAFPAKPDSEYGWEKIFSERLFLAAKKNYELDVKIARFHNIYGPLGAFDNGKEKAPAAICRKVAVTKNNGVIDVWGSGRQTRSFLFIEDCLDGILTLMDSDQVGPFNIGSEEMVSINQLAQSIIHISGKSLSINNIKGPVGVQGRCSNNELVRSKLNWEPKYSLQQGLEKTYHWIDHCLKEKIEVIAN